MKKQLHLFFTAVMWLTRLPVPWQTDHMAADLRGAAPYFSWVGLIVGVMTGGCFIAFREILSTPVALLMAMSAGLFITGAFHEDGFADVCDGFGGGWNKEQILRIMKDSRLGTFGVAGLVIMLALKFALLLELSTPLPSLTVMLVFATGNSMSRFAPMVLMRQFSYVGDKDTSKTQLYGNNSLTTGAFIIGGAGALLPFIFLDPLWLIAILPAIVALLLMGRYFKKRIGGYTGDCLGAVQQVCEICFYLGIQLTWKFI